MTPEEAVEQFAELRLLPPGSDYVRSAVLDILRAVALRAQTTETRRASNLCIERGTLAPGDSDTAWFRACRQLGKDILVTGGLEAEE